MAKSGYPTGFYYRESARLSTKGSSEATPTAPAAGPTTVEMEWDIVPNTPGRILGGCSAVVGDKAYFGSGTCVWQFNITGMQTQWTSLTDHDLQDFSLVNINNDLISVGGWSNERDKFSNKLYTYKGSKWVQVEKYPPMPTKRSKSTSVYAHNGLIVAGGNNGSFLSTVEMLNTNDKQWRGVSSLPFPTSWPSASVCGEYIYLQAGCTLSKEGFAVIRCKLITLLMSVSKSTNWETISSLPVTRASLVIINDLLLAVGGKNSDRSPNKSVRQYYPESDCWRTVNQVTVPRFQCSTALLPENKLIVAGGNLGYETTELATIL